MILIVLDGSDYETLNFTTTIFGIPSLLICTALDLFQDGRIEDTERVVVELETALIVLDSAEVIIMDSDGVYHN